MDALQETLATWQRKTDKLQEVQEWLRDATLELVGVPASDSRWATLKQVTDARDKIVRELEELETLQEAALTEHLERVGPLHLNFEDGSSRVLSSKSITAGGRADLLPSDLLSVWRVAAVFQGSVVLGEAPAKLEFGDKAQVATVKLTAKAKKPKLTVGEEALQSLRMDY
jgi:hypothetical protein